jgi:hypothetical protein
MYEEGEYPMYASGGDMPLWKWWRVSNWVGWRARSSFIILILKVLESYMANGNTHDESDGSGRTGIGVKVMGRRWSYGRWCWCWGAR